MPDDTVDDPRQIIADLQRQVVQYRTERDEALAQQTATAEVLGIINSSPGDLAPVFDAMLERAVRLCEYDFASLWTYDGSLFHPVARHRLPDPLWAYLQDHSPPAFARLVDGERLVHIPDVRDEAIYQTDFGRDLVRLGLETVRTVLIVPLRREEVLLGLIVAYRQEVRPFTDRQIPLLENFAAQAVIAMENARLISETREALDQQTATAEVLQVINASPGDLAPVFDAILEKAHTLCDASTGSLRIVDGDMIRAVAVRGQSGEFADRLQHGYPFSSAPLLAPLRNGAPFVHISDVAERGDSISRLSVESGNRTLLAVPLRKDDALLGMIVAGRKEVRPFSDKQIALLQNFAAQAVIAMENARLITETHEALDQQTATAEVLQVINASPGDLAPVFDAILEKAHTLCGAAVGSLGIYDGETWRAVVQRGYAEPLAERLRQPARGSDNPLLQSLLDGARLVHIPDLAQIDHPIAKANVEVGIRTLLVVPLRKDDALLGTISTARHEVRPFSDKEIVLLQNFAAQAVIAMENARLLGELRARTDEIAGWNRELEARVAAQLAELERTGRLKRFLAPQLAELIVAQGDESILESHRREIVVVFCDIRGFTAFAERAEPEEVMALLRDYHAAMGPIVARFEGTLDHYGGDGIMVFFNDPLPTPEPAKRAIEMAVTMREAAAELVKAWRGHGHDVGFGVGISQGYATLGQIGFAERMDYTAIGTVTNLAARLCDEAKDGQILISRRVATAVGNLASLEEVGDLSLKGLSQAVAVYNVAQ